MSRRSSTVTRTPGGIRDGMRWVGSMDVVGGVGSASRADGRAAYTGQAPALGGYEQREPACKPASVPSEPRVAAIHLGPALPPASCGPPGGFDRASLLRPRAAGTPPTWPWSGGGLAGRPVTRPLVRSYRTVSPLPRAPHPGNRGRHHTRRGPRGGGLFCWRLSCWSAGLAA